MAPQILAGAIVTWTLVSSLVGYFVTWGIPAISSLVLSIVLYTVAGRLGWVRGVGRARTLQPLEGPETGTAGTAGTAEAIPSS